MPAGRITRRQALKTAGALVGAGAASTLAGYLPGPVPLRVAHAEARTKGGGDVPELPNFTNRAYRAVLLISMTQKKAGLSREERRRRLANPRVVQDLRKIRSLSGVRHVEPVLFHGWRDDPGEFRDAPWKPNGALIFVQSDDQNKLKKRIGEIYKAAARLDQGMVVMEPLGDLDSM